MDILPTLGTALYVYTLHSCGKYKLQCHQYVCRYFVHTKHVAKRICIVARAKHKPSTEPFAHFVKLHLKVYFIVT
jgi:hypothetical protein